MRGNCKQSDFLCVNKSFDVPEGLVNFKNVTMKRHLSQERERERERERGRWVSGRESESFREFNLGGSSTLNKFFHSLFSLFLPSGLHVSNY